MTRPNSSPAPPPYSPSSTHVRPFPDRTENAPPSVISLLRPAATMTNPPAAVDVAPLIDPSAVDDDARVDPVPRASVGSPVTVAPRSRRIRAWCSSAPDPATAGADRPAVHAR